MARTLEDSLQALKKAFDIDSLEEAVKDVTASSTGSAAVRQAYRDQLSTVLTQDALLNAKLRRKVKRLHEILESCPTSQEVPQPPPSQPDSNKSATQDQQASSDQPVSEEEVVEVDMEAVTVAVKACKTAPELEAAVSQVRPGVGNCGSRRKLKRAIESVLKLEEVETSMNARIRRRMARVLKIVGPGGAELAAQAAAANDANKKRSAQSMSSGSQEEDDSARKRRKVPYVAFVGQLPYETSREALENHIRHHVQLLGSLDIRLLTDSQTKKSKGMAFVSVDNAEDLYSLLTLHHSQFKGRSINVERSCGGKDKEKRKSKLDEQRKAQQAKLAEICKTVLNEYEAKGVIQASKFGTEFLEKVLRYAPARLSSTLKAYEKLPKEQRTLTKLDTMLTNS
eukprot:gene2344-2566_t